MSSNTDWTPLMGIGRIRFGVPIQKYLQTGVLMIETMPEELGGEDTFVNDDDGITVTPDSEGQELVDLIQCDKSIIYNGRELLGLSIEEVVGVLGQPPSQYGEEIEVGEDIQVVAEFDDLGLMLWMKDGVTDSASLDDGNYEDGES